MSHGICADGVAIFAVMHNGRCTVSWELAAKNFAEAELEVVQRNTLCFDFLYFETKRTSEETRLSP